MDREVVKANLQDLIDRYNNNLRTQDRNGISEETIRVWINEFLQIFGWDVQDTSQVLQEYVLRGAEQERLREINSTHKKPDYILMNGTNIKCFLDVKKLDVNIFASRSVAYQIRSYGWSAQVPCSFVSNLEQFAIFDTRFTPNPDQLANIGVIQLNVDEYIENFDMLFDHLCHDNICANRLEELYQMTAIEGRNQVDSSFTDVLSDFRVKLAQNLYELNSQFITNNEILNYYVQVILDRIVFIRVCESKNIEEIEKLRHFSQSENGFWTEFKNSCYLEFYNHYDGAMFSRADNFMNLELDNDILCDFIDKLYYPYPYKFDVIPVKVIANIYEEFLGKQLLISEDGIREVLKNEYIRTRGAVATPEHIVEMVCKQTLDLSTVLTIEDLLSVKILDPCCGSGVFLISCYEQLSKKMISILMEDEDERQSHQEYFYTFNDQILLTIAARRAIITNCIHGIDCDEAAIEVTKMSLALKIVDGNNTLAWRGIGAFGEHILSDIDKNIKIGNTLVDVDGTFTADEIMDIKPFNIRYGFQEIFENYGGFSYIIGNPPYVETKHYKAAQPAMHEYLHSHYNTFEGKADLAVLFIERCLQLLDGYGKLGFIIQRRWFKTDYGRAARELINNGKHLERLIDFKATDIFKGRMVYASIMILNKSQKETMEYYYLPDSVERIKVLFENSDDSGMFEGCEFSTIPNCEGSSTWNFDQHEILTLVNKYREAWGTFSDMPNLLIKDGIQVLWKKVYDLHDVSFNGDIAVGINGFGEEVTVERGILRGVVYNREFYPFKNIDPDVYCIFPYVGASNTRIPFSEMEDSFPLAYQYLHENEDRIKNAVKCRDGDLWHTYTREHNHSMYSVDKIIIPMTARDTIATYMPNSDLYMDNANVWFVTIPGAQDNVMKAITCVINSTIFSVLGKAKANPQAGGYYKFNKQFLGPIPFPSQKMVDSPEIESLAAIYDSIQELQENYMAAPPTLKTVIAYNLAELWDRLDTICYQLYEATNCEIEQMQEVGRTVSRIELLAGVNA